MAVAVAEAEAVLISDMLTIETRTSPGSNAEHVMLAGEAHLVNLTYSND